MREKLLRNFYDRFDQSTISYGNTFIQPMNFLLINTSLPMAEIAIFREDQLLARREWPSDRELGRKLLAAIQTVLEQSQLESGEIDRIAVQSETHPGSFMALRTGMVSGMMLAEAWQCDLVRLQGGVKAHTAQAVRQAIPIDIL